MSGLHVVVGARGQIGRHVVRALAESDRRIRTVARSPMTTVSTGEHACGDIGDLNDAARLCAGAEVVYACFGGPHRTWASEFPRMSAGLLAGAARAGARVVFADNLYAYGPQDSVLHEHTTSRPVGRKPRLRAEVAEMFLAAHRRGDVRVAIARASDLYGPGVDNAMLSARFVATALAGRTSYLPGDLDAPHTFSFVPDVARAMVELGASDDAWGEIWHVPSAPAVSLRSLVEQIAALSGARARVIRLPELVVRLAGVFDPQIRELIEMAFQWDRPYLVSHAKFAARFATEATSIAQGLRTTRDWVTALER